MLLFLFACQNNKRSTNQQSVTHPNTEINKSNSYNDIFFDSSLLNKFYASTNTDQDVMQEMNSFYYGRNFEFAWFSTAGLNEQARSLWNLLTYTKVSTKDTALYNRALKNKMANLITNDSLVVTASDTSILQTEFLLTQYFLSFLDRKIDDAALDSNQLNLFIPARKEELLTKSNELIKLKKSKSNDVFSNKDFNSLLTQLQKYYIIVKNKGWQPIPFSGKILRNGINSPLITAIKKRLSITGDMQTNDTTSTFDSALAIGVRNFQASLGYTPTGVVNDSLIKDMNVSAEARLQQILINLNRMQWMPSQDSGKLILCNIPEYKLYVYENGKTVLQMNTVVGKDGHNTVIFTGNLSEIVFSPYWNIPPSIIKKEILPKMKANKNYLKENHMEITGQSDGLPVVRQLPGPKNSLGRVKFLFPNDFNIYFHDTPEKSLFQKDKRAYSHGCIRLSEPVQMAEYLLKDDKAWTPEKITAAMNSGKESHVELKKSVPVLITYYTSWVDDFGRLNFRDDIYGHDSTMAANMFIHPAK